MNWIFLYNKIEINIHTDPLKCVQTYKHLHSHRQTDRKTAVSDVTVEYTDFTSGVG